jgi:hypothetical protein
MAAVTINLAPRKIRFKIVKGAVMTFDCNILILKYTTELYGADLQVEGEFHEHADAMDDPSLAIDE